MCSPVVPWPVDVGTDGGGVVFSPGVMTAVDMPEQEVMLNMDSVVMGNPSDTTPGRARRPATRASGRMTKDEDGDFCVSFRT